MLLVGLPSQNKFVATKRLSMGQNVTSAISYVQGHRCFRTQPIFYSTDIRGNNIIYNMFIFFVVYLTTLISSLAYIIKLGVFHF
jgi:hypothetical protein